MDRHPVELLPGLTHRCLYWAVALVVLGAVVLLALPGGWLAMQRSVQGARLDKPETVGQAEPAMPEVWVVPAQQMLDDSYVGYTVWDLSAGNDLATWRIEYSNAAASEVVGVDMQRCLGRRVLECFPALDSAGGQRYAELVRFAKDSGETVNVGVTALQTEGKTYRYYFSVIIPLDESHVALIYHNLFDDKTVGMPAQYLVDLELSEAQVLRAQLEALEKSLSRVRDTIQEAP